MLKKIIDKRLKFAFCLGLFVMFWNCKSSDISESSKHANNIAKLEMLLDKDSYSIDIDVAFPFVTAATQQVANALFLSRTGNTASRVDVRGDGHFIKIQQDSVKGDLSFIGERRISAGPYGSTNTGIGFAGIPEKFKKTINTKKRTLEIKFNTSQNEEPSENYNILVIIFPNNSVEVDITSTFKTFMRYSGTLKPEDESQ